MLSSKSDTRAIAEGCYYDQSIPDKVRKFAQQFCAIEDKPGEIFNFHAWQWEHVICKLYGWRTREGYNRFTRGSIWCPRKVCKSTTLSAVILFELLRVQSAQIYLVSSSVESASQIFRMAAYSVEQGPLKPYIKIKTHLKELHYGNSFCKVLSGGKKGRSGQGATCVIWDELAEIDTDTSWHRLYNSSRARRKDSPIWLSISSPQYEVFPLSWQQFTKARAIIDGTDDDPTYLAAIAQVPDNEPNWDKPEIWVKYLPNVPSVVSLDTLKQEYEQACISPRDLARFRNHSLGQWSMDSANLWINYDTLDANFADFNDEFSELLDQECIIGIDGAMSNLSAYSLYFTESKHVIIRYFIPEETARKDDAKNGTNYLSLSKDEITLTTGDMFDWSVMLEAIQQDMTKYNVVEVGFDPFCIEQRMEEYSQQIDANVFPVLPYRSHVARPTRYIERQLLSKQLKIQKHPLSTLGFRNARVKEDAHENITLDREKSLGRYDGVAATVIALARYLIREDNSNPYDDNDLMII